MKIKFDDITVQWHSDGETWKDDHDYDPDDTEDHAWTAGLDEEEIFGMKVLDNPEFASWEAIYQLLKQIPGVEKAKHVSIQWNRR